MTEFGSILEPSRDIVDCLRAVILAIAAVR